MLVLLNPTAGGGKARRRWERVAAEVARRAGPFTLIATHSDDGARQAVAAALAAGETTFVAAGGDGTVNLVASALLAHSTADARRHIALGAVGLGSSNDFHKPRRPDAAIHGVPVRLDVAGAVPHDVGRLRYVDGDGQWRCRRWLLNASLGTTAEGNRRYNVDPAVARLKRLHPDLGMAWAALTALWQIGPRPMTVATDGEPAVPLDVTNLAVIKNPHVSGVLRYDSPYDPASGWFDVHVLNGASRSRRARTLAALCRGRFQGLPGTMSWRARRLRVRTDVPIAVEGDGEIVLTREVEFSLDQRALWVCA
ncbi:MAG: diacylglycerol kinase family protein [Gemmatimonadota bacterium]|nr:diacylglycerol kinase family protein [Gemmatimonadota bacterium]